MKLCLKVPLGANFAPIFHFLNLNFGVLELIQSDKANRYHYFSCNKCSDGI